MKSRIRTNLFAGVIGAMTTVLSAGPVEAVTTVVIVRHAEKQVEPGNRDPALTAGGLLRAEALAHTLQDMSIAAVYSSNYQRTRQTAAPTAKRAGVETILYDPRDSDGLRDAILEDHQGGAVLVVGHSNTVPAVLASFGVDNPKGIADNQYGDLFVVLIPDEPVTDGSGPVTLHLHFGEPVSSREPGETHEKD